MVEVNTTLPDGEPERTLGWDVIRWCESQMLSPMADGSPLRFTLEQCRFVAWWYAVDGDGRWLYRRGVLRRAKGWGKDPFAAILALVEMLGPSRVGGWDSAGEPFGAPAAAPLVAVAATSEAQTRNTTAMLDVVAGPRLRKRHRLRLGERVCRGVTETGVRAELRPVTSSWRSSEGARVTAVIAGETQHWRATNGGHNMHAVLARNLAKAPDGSARMLAITNAHEPGEDSVAERDHEAWIAQQREPGHGDIFLDNREAVIDDKFDVRDPAQMIPAVRATYGDATWINAGRLADDAKDPETSVGHSARFFLNRITAGAGKWMDPAALEATERQGPIPDAGEPIAVGFDGSRTQDATALVCTHMETGRQWLAGIWERDWDVDDWEVPSDDVHAAVDRIFNTWRVARMYCDPAWWEEDVAAWCGRWPNVAAAWHMTGGRITATARAITAYHGAVMRKEMTWGGPDAATFRAHCLHAVVRPVKAHLNDDGRLHTISKTSRRSRDCIDVAVAGVLSWQARLDALAAGWEPPPRFRGTSLAQARARQEAKRKAAEAAEAADAAP